MSGRTKDEVRDKLAELVREQRDTGRVGRRDLTVGHVVADLLAHPPRGWRSPVTMGVNRAAAGRITAALGTVKLTRLTAGDVERRLLRPMAEQGLSTSAIAGTRRALIMAIRRAQRDHGIVRNVAELAEVPDGTVKVSRSLTLDQIGALFASGLTPWWRAYLSVGIMCGLRPGELTGLRWQDVDFSEGVIRVRKSLNWASGQPVLDDLKTESSRRTMTMPAAVTAALKALSAEQAAARLRLGVHYADQGLVFPDPAGGPMWRQTVGRQFRAVCDRAGVGGGSTFTN